MLKLAMFSWVLNSKKHPIAEEHTFRKGWNEVEGEGKKLFFSYLLYKMCPTELEKG